MILASAVLSQYIGVTDRETDRRQTTHYDNSGICNAIAMFCFVHTTTKNTHTNYIYVQIKYVAVQ